MNEFNTYPVNKSVWGPKMIIAVCAIVIMSVIVIAGMSFMLASGAFNQPKTDLAQGSYDEPILVVTSCPDSVNSNNPSFTAEGIIVSDSSACSLYINGEKVASTGKAGEQVKWTKAFQLFAGEKRQLAFEVVDSNGNKSSEIREVYCQSLQSVPKLVSKPITPGCNLTKKKAGGLNIREYPGTIYDVVDFIQSYDYTSTMVFTGNYTVAYDGYTWYEVISPKGKHGYVRSDLVANYQYVN